MKFPLLPPRGFVSSVPRQEVPISALTGPSRNWLTTHGRLRRRSGSQIVGDTLAAGAEVAGHLESKWGARARRIIAATLRSIADKFPVPLTLHVNEVLHAATLCFRSTNGAGSWRTIGKEFSVTHYPATGVPAHRVVPMVYENEYGGITLHRLNTAEYREHMAAGSRSVIQAGGQVCWGGYRSAPTRWNGRFNDATGSGSEPCEVFPLGMIPPLQMPVCSAGNLTSSSGATPGPWKGSEAFFFSVMFENDRGELSMFTMPRPPGSAWEGYPGFGYVQVDPSNPSKFYDSMIFSFIPKGPPGTRWVHILRSSKVDVATTGAGAIVQPAIDTLSFFARVPQGVTSYVSTEGNDSYLDPDSRISDMFRNGIQWPPRARYMGRFDGHETLGFLRPNPYALIVAPWKNGAQNLAIDDAGLYGATSYFVAVEQTQLCLRSVLSGANTDVFFDLAGRTIRQLVDDINADSTTTTLTLHNCSYGPGVNYVDRSTAFAGVSVGDVISDTNFPPGTRVTRADYTVGPLHRIDVSDQATAYSPTLADGGADLVFISRVSGALSPWCAQVVPGADAEESCDSLLRTFVRAITQFQAGSPIVWCTSDIKYITPGMLVYSRANGSSVPFPASTIVLSVSGLTATLSNPATRDWQADHETVDFAYDTGDTTLALNPGFVRAFGNAFPMVCPWNKAYTDRFDDSPQESTFSAASPGYAQDGINTWMEKNRRGAPSSFGPLMGFADVGPLQVEFYSRARMLLYNPRTGLTHADDDYTKITSSWTRGCRSPYAICAGNGWVIYLSDEGLFAISAQQPSMMSPAGEVLISKALYDAGRPVGSRGELEYAIGACIAASESDSDDFKIHANVENGVLFVNYWSAAGSGYPDRQVRYDFSSGTGRTGLQEVLQEDGTPYPWSTPQTLRVSCSMRMPQVDGLVHHFAAIDSNAGAADGRIDEIDTGTEDNGEPVVAVGYTGLQFDEALDELQPNRVYVVASNAGDGLKVAITQQPELDPDVATWDVLDIPTSESDAFGRAVVWLDPSQSLRRAALAARITHDGSGPVPEISMVILEGEKVRSTTTTVRKQ